MARCAFSVNVAAFNSMMRSIRSLTAFSFRFAGNFFASNTLGILFALLRLLSPRCFRDVWRHHVTHHSDR